MKKTLFIIISLFFALMIPINTLAEVTSFSDSSSIEYVTEFSEEGTTFSSVDESTTSSTVKEEINQTAGGMALQALGSKYYTVDYGPLAPKESGLELLPVVEMKTTTYKEFKDLLQSDSLIRIKLIGDIMFPNDEANARIVIPEGGNKELDLNGNKLIAGTKGQIEVQSDYFNMKNGSVRGGYWNESCWIPSIVWGENHAYARGGFIYSPTTSKTASLVFENITHESEYREKDDKARGGFVVGINDDIFFSGVNKLTNGNFNAKGGNVTFINGDFTGEVTYNGGWYNAGPFSRERGAVNLSFPGYDDQKRRPANAFDGTRRVTVKEEASVNLTNHNTNHSEYNNNIGNFSTITVDGEMRMTCKSPAMRTIASERDTQSAGNYESDAQTWNGMANININEGAIFYAESTHPSGNSGVIYTYRLNVNVDNPYLLDLRYFGNWNFFRAYYRGFGPADIRNSNFNVYNSDLGVWNRDKLGVKNPDEYWQNMDYLKVSQFYEGNRGSVTAEPKKNKIEAFDINKYGRVSNDITVPVVIPGEEFEIGSRKYQVGNGSDKFYGTTAYRNLEDGSIVNKPAVGAKIEIRDATNKVVTETLVKEDGSWEFDAFFKKRIKAGNHTLRLEDKGQREDSVPILIKDTLPPIGESKLYIFEEKLANALNSPQTKSLKSYEDETTTDKNKLKFAYRVSDEDKARGIDLEHIRTTPGFYEVYVDITDEAGNTGPVLAPIMVHEKGKPVFDSFVSGRDFNIDFHKWDMSSDSEKQQFVKDPNYGYGRAFKIDKVTNTYTEVTDTTDFIIDIPTKPSGGWQPDTSHSIKLSLGTYSRTIEAHLEKKSVNMTVIQVYEDQNGKKIYKDISDQPKEVDEFKYTVDSGADLMSELEKYPLADSNFKLTYDWYNSPKKNEYKIMIDGQESPPLQKVPTKDFTILYEYGGKMTVEASNLHFGQEEVTGVDGKIGLPKGGNATQNKDIEIINTTLSPEWKLNVSVPKGIKTIPDNVKSEVFLGHLMFERNGNPVTIGSTGTKFTDHVTTGDKMTTVIPMDIKLIQNVGNKKSHYKGEMLWSLEDSP
ncbi:hypothetical protein DOK76_05340 [Vagococcus sp. DIV0080]|uniref:WxL domain-containing protein n=1 Tax=Candidatus Vagococcus giribetii TaxID=2230876 RepID=A0ABS3HRV2_9ENTE|nr:hypothetical protein [Vagococcus sp. DIV0080]MBO0476485.1 hypothetical protein [Vagococcus sp. DIV0080]